MFLRKLENNVLFFCKKKKEEAIFNIFFLKNILYFSTQSQTLRSHLMLDVRIVTPLRYALPPRVDIAQLPECGLSFFLIYFLTLTHNSKIE
jgi:hypothetical protein